MTLYLFYFFILSIISFESFKLKTHTIKQLLLETVKNGDICDRLNDNDPSTPLQSFVKQTSLPDSVNPFCDVCASNQKLIIQIQSATDDSCSRKELELRYPTVCEVCIGNVEERMRHNNMVAKHILNKSSTLNDKKMNRMIDARYTGSPYSLATLVLPFILRLPIKDTVTWAVVVSSACLSLLGVCNMEFEFITFEQHIVKAPGFGR